MDTKKIIYQFIVILFLCVIIEGVSFLILRSQHKTVGFLIKSHKAKPKHINDYQEIGLDEIDPLCGWAWSDKTIQDRGFEVANNCAVVRSKGNLPSAPLKIFITGGSTSDMTLKSPNWINELQLIFEQHKINAVFYCAAVCGYNSWQELQKTLRDGLSLSPDIHISYSGANECSTDAGFVSKYENDFYENAMRQNLISPVLPSTVYLFKRGLFNNTSCSGVGLKKQQKPEPFNLWAQSMGVMSGMAIKNGYHFVGILQPVLGQGNYKQSNAAEVDSAGKVGRSAMFKSYYPQAQQYLRNTDTTLCDFTHIFDTAQGQVFVDFCHIDGPYETTVAQNVYEVLVKRGYLAETVK